MSTPRQIIKRSNGQQTSDGAGVNLTRLIGTPELDMIDPFLMLDQFGSDEPQDYIAGFPPHPHRGFETVSYLLNGRMRHQDNAGNEGVIESGGVQWMTAGRGVVHSEMPEQEDGLLSGFQLWINLPADHKLDSPAYQEFSAANIPVERLGDGVTVRVIAGSTASGTSGPVTQPLTEPVYLDVSLSANSAYQGELPLGHNAFIYVIEGNAQVGETSLGKGQLGILGTGNYVTLKTSKDAARLLLIAGKPIGEPVARGGPFVMNTEDEIRQAFADYKGGLMG